MSVIKGENVVIKEGTILGENVVIGDNVYIGPNVCIVENVKIGNNTTIGAGSVVIRDIPENSTVVGCPARVIGENKHPEYVNRRWYIE